MKNLLLLLLLYCQLSLCVGQSPVLDSLKRALAQAKSDTARVLLYEKLIYAAAPNPKAINEYGQQGLRLAKRIHFPKGAILCGNSLGFLMVEIDYYRAISILMDTKKLCEIYNNQIGLANALAYLGYAYGKFDLQKSLYYYNQCKKLMEKANISEDEVPINTAIGYDYKDFGVLDSALVYLRKGYQHALKSRKSRVEYSSYYMYFGEIYYKKGQPDLAMQYLRRSFSECKNSFGHDYLWAAYIFRDRNQLDSAKHYAQISFNMQKEKNRTVYIIQAANLLYELNKTTNPAEALKYLYIASVTKDSLFNQEKAQQVEKFAFEEREQEARTRRRIEANRLAYQNQIRLYSLLGILSGVLLLAFVLYRNNQQKQKVNTVLAKTLSALRSTQAQLIQSEKLASLGELTAGIAHEIQNPLNFVNNFSELSVELADELKAEIKKPELDKGLIEELATDLASNQQKINHHGQRASSIVKGMLEHSRTSTGMKEPTDINALADEYLRLAYHGLRAKDSTFNATMETHFDPDLPLVSVIPQDMGRVLLNLINNAFYAVTEKAKQGIEGYQPGVIIVTENVAENIEIRVKDNGLGIPESLREKVFQPFFTTKPTGQGTGLGLSLAYDIVVKGHGGSLEVTSNIDAENSNPIGGKTGTEFVILLPKH